jgi:hypothetical protein
MNWGTISFRKFGVRESWYHSVDVSGKLISGGSQCGKGVKNNAWVRACAGIQNCCLPKSIIMERACVCISKNHEAPPFVGTIRLFYHYNSTLLLPTSLSPSCLLFLSRCRSFQAVPFFLAILCNRAILCLSTVAFRRNVWYGAGINKGPRWANT